MPNKIEHILSAHVCTFIHRLANDGFKQEICTDACEMAQPCPLKTAFGYSVFIHLQVHMDKITS
jgi:hypothetical protein